MDMIIRQELTADYQTTEAIVKSAFLNEAYSDHQEHLLVQRIRQTDAFIPELSLVAIQQDELVGHILLSKIHILDGDKAVESLALAPVSVAPSHQKMGIGSQLIRAALKKAQELGYRSVILLGHKDYYPKFGFQPASNWHIRAPFEVPDEAFMALELTENALADVRGIVRYSEAFA